MTQQLTTDQVWQDIEKELFAVIGMVTAKGEARTAGIVYIVRDRKLYISSGKEAWKVRHVEGNPNVSLTIPIAKRIPIMPWIKIPAATITFSGTARLMITVDASPALLRAVFHTMADDQEVLASTILIEVTPKDDFVTYGVGIPLKEMRPPEKARGRSPVN